jgi:hypothetical protein
VISTLLLVCLLVLPLPLLLLLLYYVFAVNYTVASHFCSSRCRCSLLLAL